MGLDSVEQDTTIRRGPTSLSRHGSVNDVRTIPDSRQLPVVIERPTLQAVSSGTLIPDRTQDVNPVAVRELVNLMQGYSLS